MRFLFLLSLVTLLSQQVWSQAEQVPSLDVSENEKIIFIQKDKAIYAQIIDVVQRNNGPIYECCCKGDGLCELKWLKGSSVACVSGSPVCTDPDNINFVGCGWRKASKLSEELELAFLNERDYLWNIHKDFELAEGIMLLSQRQIKIKEGSGISYQIEENGSISFLRNGKAYGPMIQCDCSCDVGSCNTTGGGQYLNCIGKCSMTPDGNPCDGCFFKIIKK